jgi:hypothetical protein
MAKRTIVRQRKATFLRLRQIREEMLGWDIADIVSRLPGHRPSSATIYRLEQGEAIRVTNARRVFDVVNAALNNKLNPRKELKMK